MKNVGILESLIIESLLEILTKRRSQMFCKLMDVTSAINENKASMILLVALYFYD